MRVTSEFIRGAKARAAKDENLGKEHMNWQDYQEFWAGYQHMTKLLSPIETNIIVATLQYSATARKEVSELEAQLNGTVEGSAEPTVPSERPQVPAPTDNVQRV